MNKLCKSLLLFLTIFMSCKATPCLGYPYLSAGAAFRDEHEATALTGAGVRWPFYFFGFDSAWQYPLKKQDRHRDGGFKHGALLIYLQPESFITPYIGVGTFLPAKEWKQMGLIMIGLETNCGMPIHLFCDATFYRDKKDGKNCWDVQHKSEVAALVRVGVGL